MVKLFPALVTVDKRVPWLLKIRMVYLADSLAWALILSALVISESLVNAKDGSSLIEIVTLSHAGLG